MGLLGFRRGSWGTSGAEPLHSPPFLQPPQLLSVLEHSSDKLQEEALHEASVPWQQPLQESNVATARCYQQCHVGQVPGSLHGDGCKETCGSAASPTTPQGWAQPFPAPLTVQGGKGVVGSVEAQRGHTDAVQAAGRAGSTVILCAGAVAKGQSGVTLIKLPDGACLGVRGGAGGGGWHSVQGGEVGHWGGCYLQDVLHVHRVPDHRAVPAGTPSQCRVMPTSPWPADWGHGGVTPPTIQVCPHLRMRCRNPAARRRLKSHVLSGCSSDTVVSMESQHAEMAMAATSPAACPACAR